ncbi:MAG: DUF1289 domain-containing protein [Rheinheimera sp.]|jgi:predicted Fe-S protein YdhL (DUF1289 family)
MTLSPCQRNCCLDQDDICLGCGRSLSEICGWHQADHAVKQQILSAAEQRLIAKKRPNQAFAMSQASRDKPT